MDRERMTGPAGMRSGSKDLLVKLVTKLGIIDLLPPPQPTAAHRSPDQQHARQAPLPPPWLSVCWGCPLLRVGGRRRMGSPAAGCDVDLVYSETALALRSPLYTSARGFCLRGCGVIQRVVSFCSGAQSERSGAMALQKNIGEEQGAAR